MTTPGDEVPSPDDAALWRRAADGEPDCFGEIFDRHASAVHAYCRARVGDPHDAQDKGLRAAMIRGRHRPAHRRAWALFRSAGAGPDVSPPQVRRTASCGD